MSWVQENILKIFLQIWCCHHLNIFCGDDTKPGWYKSNNVMDVTSQHRDFYLFQDPENISVFVLSSCHNHIPHRWQLGLSAHELHVTCPNHLAIMASCLQPWQTQTQNCFITPHKNWVAYAALCAYEPPCIQDILNFCFKTFPILFQFFLFFYGHTLDFFQISRTSI